MGAKMRSRLFNLTIFIFFSVYLVAFGFGYKNTSEKSFEIVQDQEFYLKNCNGSIEVNTYKGNTIFIKSVKYSESKKYFDDSEIVYTKSGNKLKVFTKTGSKNCKISVNYYIKLPVNIEFTKIKTVNGGIHINGSLKDITIGTINGKLSYSGSFRDGRFSTVNGNINLYVKDPLSGDLNVKSVNGSVKIEINGNSSFNLSARTINGSMRSDFNLNQINHFVGSSMKGIVNKGKYDIIIKTVNGNAKILRF